MRRLARPSLVLALLVLPASALAAPPTLPPLPGAGGPAAAPGAPAKTDERPAEDKIRKGVVQVEQAGRPIAIGTVLGRDGRVLTSLSGLGAVTEPEIRYADGTVVKAKIGHKDKGWDLALLVPQTGRWLDGLAPTDLDPSSLELKAFLPAKTGKLAQVPVDFKGRLDAKSKDGDPLRSALDLDLKGSTAVPGAPLLGPAGEVVGVLVRVCKETPAADVSAKDPPKDPKPEAKSAPPACSAVTVGAPVYALRGFLMKTPATAALPQAWLGLGGAPSEAGNVHGVRVMGLAPGSPAEKAGLKAGDAPDTIVAVDGQPVETPEQLAEVIAKRAIGQSVKLLVYSAGKFREVPVTLKQAP